MPRLAQSLIVLVLTATPSLALVDSALELDGKGACLEVATDSSLHASRALTVTGWFRADGALSARGWQALFWKGDTPDASPYGNREAGLWLSRAGQLQLASTPADSGVHRARLLTSDKTRVHPGRWHHFAAVVSADDGQMRIYLDGRPVAEGPYPGVGPRSTSGPLRLGGIPDRDYFHGLLDEVRLWDRALTAPEIARDLHLPLQATAPGLLAAYTFDRLDAQGRVADASGNGHAGRLLGGARLTHVRVLAPPAATVADSAALTVTTATPPVRPIRGALADVLIDALYSDDYHVRARATESLDQVAIDDLPRVLRHALDSEHYAIRSRAADVLARLEEHGAGDGSVMTVHASPVAVVDLPALTAPASRPPRPRPRRLDVDAYRGWEARWLAPGPSDLTFEPEGPVAGYNRVDGIYGGWRLPRTYRRDESLTHFGSATYGLASRALRYQAGGEVYTFYGPSGYDLHLATVGGELHDGTDTQDGWLLPEEENSIDALLFRRDFRDYYRRTGWSAYTAHNVGGVLQLTGRYQRDEFRPLDAEAEWGLFGGRFGRAAFRPNPAIAAQQIRSLRGDVQLDTRDDHDGPERGWLANALFERAGGLFGGDARFRRYLADVRRYQPLSRGARLDLRLRLGTAKGSLPLQYHHDLGGYGSLRGYDFKAFSGDRMVLLNAEYWLDADRHWHGDLPADDLRLGAFLDTGAAWTADDADDPFAGLAPLLGGDADPGDPELRTSVGLAAGFGDGIKFYAAHPLSGADDWVLSLRFSRSL